METENNSKVGTQNSNHLVNLLILDSWKHLVQTSIYTLPYTCHKCSSKDSVVHDALIPRDTSFSIEFTSAINAREQKEVTLIDSTGHRKYQAKAGEEKLSPPVVAIYLSPVAYRNIMMWLSLPYHYFT